jgi:exodeoxyribonuclease-3
MLAVMPARPLRFVSWNVNGLRSILKKGFLDFFAATAPDVLCLQEVRATPEQVDALAWPAGYHRFWNAATKAGYSGTAVFTRIEPLGVMRGIGVKEHDGEGRVLTLEFADFFVVNCYTPNSGRELERLAYRGAWDEAFLAFLKKLEKKKPVAFCGDMNVAHTEIDLARPKQNVRNHGFTPEERAGFTRLIEAGFIDTFREFEKGTGHYSWWSIMGGARARNVGWRIDYWAISKALRPRLRRAWIMKDVTGSDHCPVAMELE